ncbi:MAG: homoserine kinase [Selenomonadaceae bacterium]|nr:homoserine kinase [Selenomonadaceae bacterium]
MRNFTDKKSAHKKSVDNKPANKKPVDNKNRVIVRVPGTSANCGPGFDCLGVAATIYNYLDLTLLRTNKFIVESKGAGSDKLPRNRRNLAWQAIKKLLEVTGHAEEYKGAIIRMKSNVPISRGLGSSSTAIVAGLTAANAIVGSPLDKNELLTLATELEGHPDNVAPAIFGGFTVSVMNNGGVQTFSFMPRVKLKLIVTVPNFELSTRIARKVLPKNVSMKDAIFNVSRASMLIAALVEGRADLLPLAFDDALHQPYRKKLVPGMTEVFEAAKSAGALGAAISGAGSCLIAFTTADSGLENKIAAAMVEAFKSHGVDSKALILNVDRHGAQVMKH